MSRFRKTPNAYVWLWREAPAEYRALSRHGGDEDYVIVCPANDQIGQQLADRLMVCDYEKHHYLGRDVYITAHA